MALLTSLVPGLFMAVLFGQMRLAAMPVQGFFGESDGMSAAEVASMRGVTLEEQVILKTGPVEPDWTSIDPRIEGVVQVLPCLYTLSVPTYKGMGEVLLRFATHEELQVLQISNQAQVQVRVELRERDQLQALREMPGCEVMFEYKFPLDKHGNPDTATTVALCVEIPYLLDVFRMCNRLHVDVMQVYDWYC